MLLNYNARPAGFEPATYGLEGRCSIQLSYGRIKPIPSELPHAGGKIGRGGEIRTPDILLPKQARYQAALHPENGWHINQSTARPAKNGDNTLRAVLGQIQMTKGILLKYLLSATTALVCSGVRVRKSATFHTYLTADL